MSTIVADVCAICLESRPASTDPGGVVLECSHIFHKSCIATWFDRRNTCPLCKRVFSDETRRLITPTAVQLHLTRAEEIERIVSAVITYGTGLISVALIALQFFAIIALLLRDFRIGVTLFELYANGTIR